jgi:DNA modification methylase
MPDLDFTTHNTLYATHGLHAYAAKCPPQLVAYGLRYYSKPAELILDPMAGSGTTLVESRLMGRHAIGYDIDPLARLIARVKSCKVSDKSIEQAYLTIASESAKDVTALRSGTPSAAVRERATPPEFPNRDYWFDNHVSEALAILSYHISNTRMSKRTRDFFWVAFSSLILAKTSVANARDIIHSRHHYWQHAEQPNVLEKFAARVKVMRKQMAEFRVRCLQSPATTSEVRIGDARRLRLKNESVDLVFTSPPYATALDYPRAHFLAVAWMQRALGINLQEYRSAAPAYVGSERGRIAGEFRLDARLRRFDLTQAIVTQLAERSSSHAKHTQRYFVDMLKVFSQIERLLKPRRHAIIVVCPSHIRKLEVPTHEVFVELGRSSGLRIKAQHTRTINMSRRILPYMQEAFGKRMDTEYVMIFQKNS